MDESNVGERSIASLLHKEPVTEGVCLYTFIKRFKESPIEDVPEKCESGFQISFSNNHFQSITAVCCKSPKPSIALFS